MLSSKKSGFLLHTMYIDLLVLKAGVAHRQQRCQLIKLVSLSKVQPVLIEH